MNEEMLVRTDVYVCLEARVNKRQHQMEISDTMSISLPIFSSASCWTNKFLHYKARDPTKRSEYARLVNINGEKKARRIGIQLSKDITALFLKTSCDRHGIGATAEYAYTCTVKLCGGDGIELHAYQTHKYITCWSFISFTAFNEPRKWKGRFIGIILKSAHSF